MSLFGFCALAFAFTWICWLSIGLARNDWFTLPVAEDTLATIGQFGPFVSAIVFAAIDGRDGGVRGLFHRLFRWRAHPIWYAVALLLPPALMIGALVVHGAMQMEQFSWPSFGDTTTLLPHVLMTLLVGGPLGEEPGWRGFALPRLRQTLRPIPASIVLGFIWAAWHLPLWWIADVPPLWLYVVGIIPLTYLFTWVFERANGSVLLALLMHASMNVSLVRLPIFTAWVEWTIVLWIVGAMVAVAEWSRSRSATALTSSANPHN